MGWGKSEESLKEPQENPEAVEKSEPKKKASKKKIEKVSESKIEADYANHRKFSKFKGENE